MAQATLLVGHGALGWGRCGFKKALPRCPAPQDRANHCASARPANQGPDCSPGARALCPAPSRFFFLGFPAKARASQCHANNLVSLRRTGSSSLGAALITTFGPNPTVRSSAGAPRRVWRGSRSSRVQFEGVTRSVQYRTLVHCKNPPRVRAISRARAIFRTKSVSSIISRWVSRIGTRGPPLRVPRGRGVPTETSTEGFVPNVVVSESGVPLGRRYDDVKN